MTYSPRNGKHSPLPFYANDPHSSNFLYDGLPAHVRDAFNKPISQHLPSPRAPFQWRSMILDARRYVPKTLPRTRIILIFLWILILRWGEKTAISGSISDCQWENWERWPSEAAPHHAILVTDPQLVDPHTYPGRPWPLSTFTERHTDQYLRRAFTSLRFKLDPETVFFLGDLFDGGREWSTGKSQSPLKEWNKYKTDFWLNEYDRFGRIFLTPWNTYKSELGMDRERKLVANLPGNHDLGFGNGIQLPVRQRFSTFFGEGNRVDVVGNHTFVSVDTVSLEAKFQNIQSDIVRDPAIWGPSEEFLKDAKKTKAEVLGRSLRRKYGKSENTLLNHTVQSMKEAAEESQSGAVVGSNMPTILLTHVPLYRNPGTPCGPKRERWPPSRASTASDPLESDDRNALSISAGYQYQNVLSPETSKQLIEQIGNVEHVFSGDDHDYCEVVHRGFTSRGGIREITVKSMSWAMGVRKPGFLMVSLWNPINEKGDSLEMSSDTDASAKRDTLQSHLCILPDQLGIFIFYGKMFFLTLLILVARAWKVAFFPVKGAKGEQSQPLLPLSSPPSPNPEQQTRDRAHSQSYSANLSASETYSNGLAPRGNAVQTRNGSSGAAYGYGLPSPATPSIAVNGKSLEAKNIYSQSDFYEDNPRLRKKKTSIFLYELKWGLASVAEFALLWYTWLAFTV